MTPEDYRQVGPIVDPLRLFDCSWSAAAPSVRHRQRCEMCAAAGLRAGVDHGPARARSRPQVFIFAPRGLGSGSSPPSGLRSLRPAVMRPCQMAGISPSMWTCWASHDSFFPRWRSIPLRISASARRGPAWTGSQNGRIGLGGELPVNTNGGQLSHAQMNGWGRVRELVLQLRAAADARAKSLAPAQVFGPRSAVTPWFYRSDMQEPIAPILNAPNAAFWDAAAGGWLLLPHCVSSGRAFGRPRRSTLSSIAQVSASVSAKGDPGTALAIYRRSFRRPSRR